MFEKGQRVLIQPCPQWRFGGSGLIARSEIVETLKGPIRQYFVRFDDPVDDGSGDGPYSAGTVDEDYVEAVQD